MPSGYINSFHVTIRNDHGKAANICGQSDEGGVPTREEVPEVRRDKATHTLCELRTIETWERTVPASPRASL